MIGRENVRKKRPLSATTILLKLIFTVIFTKIQAIYHKIYQLKCQTEHDDGVQSKNAEEFKIGKVQSLGSCSIDKIEHSARISF